MSDLFYEEKLAESKAAAKALANKLTDRENLVLAAVIGGTNLGMNVPDKEDVKALLSQEKDPGIENAVMSLWQDYMENEETQNAFFMEAKWWHRDVLPKTKKEGRKKSPADREYVIRVWPHIAEVMGWL